MILPLFIFALTLFLLFFSSQTLLHQLIRLFTRLTKSSSTAVNLLFFLLLPGVLLHELSHLVIANILQVSTGHLTLKPHLKHNQLQLGSAQIQATDPFRLTFIGLAPFFTATFSLWAILKLGLQLNPAQLSFSLPPISTPALTLFLYLIFALSNTMFSSRSDLQSAALPLVLILIISLVFQFTPLNLPSFFTLHLPNLLSLLSTIFILIFIFNLILIIFIKLIQNVLH